jgi:hypothetical protein
MTGALNDNLEQRLAELTAWPGGETQVWRRALKAAPTPPRALFQWMWSWKVAAGAAVLALMVTAAAVNWPHRPSKTEVAMSNGRGVGQAFYIHANDDPGIWPEALGHQYRRPLAQTPASLAPAEQVRRGAALHQADKAPATIQAEATTPKRLRSSSSPDAEAPKDVAGTPPLLARHVIRKATIELKTDDVRAVFLKAAMVLNAARGEYVESSELTGTGKEAQAHLTLRVASDRLDDVLNQLRQLAEVRSERVEGQDVTAQVVDIEARLRNEQRVETELLQLLEKRQDAPLKEVLELRDKIAQIREEIEKLTAQRDQLSRLVSLATVLVLIRPGDAPMTQGADLGTYFTRKCRTAWIDGVQFLADTLAGLLSVLVGGLIWWVIAVVVIVVISRWKRRKARTA